MGKNSLTKLSNQWQPYLSWFDTTLQPILAELLSQLHLMLGPIKANYASNNDWHSGLGEIKQRGHYENLLLSEWLLFEEEPDEFLRRAVTHEHLFLAPTPEEQKANNVIIALFDEGALQLGHIRLAHIVIMLLLAHRASKQHSQFYWGIIQHSADLHEFEGLDSLLALLKNKSLSILNHKVINVWSDHLQNIAADERWFIGDKITSEVLLFDPLLITHQVYINQHVAEHRKLNISISGNGKIRRGQLTIPNEMICVKMLRGQLAPNSNYSELEHHTLVPISSNFSPIVSMSGNNIAALTQERKHILICSLADLLSAKTKCKVTFPPINGELLALDFQHKKIVGLVKNDEKVAIWFPNKALRPITIDIDLLDMTDTASTKFMWIYNDHGHSVYLIDKNHTLWRYDINKQLAANSAYEPIEIDKNVLSLFKLNDSKCLYATFNEHDELRLKSPQRSLNYFLSESSKTVTQILIADEKSWLNGFGVAALGMQQDWHLFTTAPSSHDSITLLFSIPAEWSVLGLPYCDKQLRLVLLHHKRKKIATFNPENNDIEEIYYSPNAIVQSQFSSLSNTLSLITENNELVLYSFATDSVKIIIKNKEGAC